MADTDTLEGYLDGFSDHRDEHPEASNRSALYAHGWRNGRDDRKRKPRAPASIIRDELIDAAKKDTAA